MTTADALPGDMPGLRGPVTEFGEGLSQIGAVIGAVGEQVAQPGKQLVEGLDDQHRPIAILAAAQN
jgi:hypothetical protein